MSRNRPHPVHPNAESSASTSTSLLDRVKARDPQSWAQFGELYGPLIYGWCRTAGMQAEDAADVAQEVFVAVAKSIAEFRRDRPGDSFRGWLWTIAANKIRDHLRRRRSHAQACGGTDAQQRLLRVAEELSSSATAPPRPDPGGSLEHRALKLVRAGVEQRTWEAFWRLTVDEQDVAKVAKELGMTPAAVYKAKYRVIRLVHKELRDLVG